MKKQTEERGTKADSQCFDLPDGRKLEVLLGGDPQGFPLVMHHGTPGSMTAFADWHTECRDRGLRLICASRPGYAGSSRLAGRSVAQVASDVAAILDALGHDRFLTAGKSGGGPHALACAALLPGRCVAAATLAGVGAYAAENLDFLDGMGPENVAEFGAAIEGEAALRRWMGEHGEALRQVTGETIVRALGGLVPEPDKAVLVGGYAERLARVCRRSLEPGFDGWVDDDLAFARPWGFRLEDIRAPIGVWQGELDLMVPFAHGRWLVECIPGATGHLVPGHGHFSLVVRYRPEILDDLVPSGLIGEPTRPSMA
jgi:pimeloyl-ACP methyl ester carboxylesterase